MVLPRYISIGGIDGSGKSTVQRMLASHLTALGKKVVAFSEPYHPFVKELVEREEDPWTHVLLFALDRWLLKPRLDRWISSGMTLVSSRSIYCSLAYQGAQGIEWERILQANDWKRLILPELFIILDLPPETAYARCSRSERFEDEEFLRLVRRQYLKLYENSALFPTRIEVVDAEPPIDQVFSRVVSLLERPQEP